MFCNGNVWFDYGFLQDVRDYRKMTRHSFLIYLCLKQELIKKTMKFSLYYLFLNIFQYKK